MPHLLTRESDPSELHQGAIAGERGHYGQVDVDSRRRSRAVSIRGSVSSAQQHDLRVSRCGRRDLVRVSRHRRDEQDRRSHCCTEIA